MTEHQLIKGGNNQKIKMAVYYTSFKKQQLENNLKCMFFSHFPEPQLTSYNDRDVGKQFISYQDHSLELKVDSPLKGKS